MTSKTRDDFEPTMADGRIRAATGHGRLADGTRVAVWLTAKGERTQVSVNHEILPDAAAAEREKRAWADRLTELAAAVEAA